MRKKKRVVLPERRPVIQAPDSWEVTHFAHLTCSPCKQCPHIQYQDYTAVCNNVENAYLKIFNIQAGISLYDPKTPSFCPLVL